MKLKRYGQFVKSINEEREAPKYDTIDDFRKQMDTLEDEKGYDMEEEPMAPKGRFDRLQDQPAELGDDYEDFDEFEAPEFDDSMPEDEMGDLVGDDDVKAVQGEVDRPEGDFGDEGKLQDLADMLGVDVTENQVKFGEHTVNYYSETGNLHIGSKEFETAKDAADFLQGGQTRMVRDTNESKSYRFKRRKNN